MSSNFFWVLLINVPIALKECAAECYDVLGSRVGIKKQAVAMKKPTSDCPHVLDSRRVGAFGLRTEVTCLDHKLILLELERPALHNSNTAQSTICGRPSGKMIGFSTCFREGFYACWSRRGVANSNVLLPPNKSVQQIGSSQNEECCEQAFPEMYGEVSLNALPRLLVRTPRGCARCFGGEALKRVWMKVIILQEHDSKFQHCSHSLACSSSVQSLIQTPF